MRVEPFDVSEAAGQTTLWLDSDRIDACLAYYAAQGIDRLAISPPRGYRAPDLTPLRGRPEIRGLTIVSPPAYDFDLTPLVGLPNLRQLIASFAIHVPLSSWPGLTMFRGYWSKELRLEEARALRTLDLSGYKSKSKDLSELPALPQLVDLSLIAADITSLHGLAQRLPQLERLELGYLRALTSIAEVALLQQLDWLECLVCRKIGDAAASLRGHRRLRCVLLNDWRAGRPRLRARDAAARGASLRGHQRSRRESDAAFEPQARRLSAQAALLAQARRAQRALARLTSATTTSTARETARADTSKRARSAPRR